MSGNYKVMVVSHVSSIPLRSGQDLRVSNMLKALSSVFDVTFVTISPPLQEVEVRRALPERIQEVIVLPPRFGASLVARFLRRMLGEVYAICTGLKSSNFHVGVLDLSPSRLEPFVGGRHFDCVLTEYWHAHRVAELFPQTPVVLDMHDILWKAREARLEEGFFRGVSKWIVPRYRRREERAWRNYDALIAINEEERNYVRECLGLRSKVFHAPMGVDLCKFSTRNVGASKLVVAYYGGLGSAHNVSSALQGAREIMPQVWRRYPDAEYWMIGGSPTEELRKLPEVDARIKVTGFVDDLNDVFSKVSIVVCPWHGTHGFRSRLVEVMAMGVPVVCSFDAVYGMGLEVGRGLLLGETSQEMAEHITGWLSSPEILAAQGGLARGQIEEKFSFEKTYLQFALDLNGWIVSTEQKDAMKV